MARRFAFALLGVLLASLSGTVPARAETNPVPVVATFSILGDFVRQVGGERVQVVSLIGPDVDAHGFQPTPGDAARVASARLVVANGLGLEGWVERLAKASGGRATIVTASRGVEPIAEAGHAHGAHGPDPHAFQSVVNAKIYVGNIRDGLAAADPDGKAVYEGNAAAYLAELDRLEVEVRAAIARIPAERRRVITSHDAFGYYASAYGIRFIAPRGVSSDTDISARDVARIIRQIKAEKIPAIFLENVSDPRLMERIAKESGTRIGGKLYSDALSNARGPAATYLDLMRHNSRTLAAALVP